VRERLFRRRGTQAVPCFVSTATPALSRNAREDSADRHDHGVVGLTVKGRRLALFLTKLHARAIRPGLQALDERVQSHAPPPLRQHFAAIDHEIEHQLKEARLIA
jgi:hypothetical protein